MQYNVINLQRSFVVNLSIRFSPFHSFFLFLPSPRKAWYSGYFVISPSIQTTRTQRVRRSGVSPQGLKSLSISQFFKGGEGWGTLPPQYRCIWDQVLLNAKTIWRWPNIWLPKYIDQRRSGPVISNVFLFLYHQTFPEMRKLLFNNWYGNYPSKMCDSRKYHSHHMHGWHWKFQGGKMSRKPKILKEIIKLCWNFQRSAKTQPKTHLICSGGRGGGWHGYFSEPHNG